MIGKHTEDWKRQHKAISRCGACGHLNGNHDDQRRCKVTDCKCNRRDPMNSLHVKNVWKT